MTKPNKFKRSKISLYNRNRFSVKVSEKGLNILTNEKVISTLKKLKFNPINECTSLFDILNKRVIIKESFNYIDRFQLRDYYLQKKIITNIPEIYGVLELNTGKTYVFSKYISDACDLKQFFQNPSNRYKKEKFKLQIKNMGAKLIREGLLPCDFQIKQMFYSPKNKKLYLCDNSISFSNPKSLLSIFKKLNINPPSKLKKLSLAYSLNPIELSLSVLRAFKKKSTKETMLSILKKQSSLKNVSGYAQKMHQKQLKKIILETIEFYDSLPLDIKQKIQTQILNNCLKQFDSL
jgi:hypothetical protein